MKVFMTGPSPFARRCLCSSCHQVMRSSLPTAQWMIQLQNSILLPVSWPPPGTKCWSLCPSTRGFWRVWHSGCLLGLVLGINTCRREEEETEREDGLQCKPENFSRLYGGALRLNSPIKIVPLDQNNRPLYSCLSQSLHVSCPMIRVWPWTRWFPVV